MSKMTNLSFDDGYKEIAINGDETRTIKVNLNDMGIVNRIQTAYNDINAKLEELEKLDENELDAERMIAVIGEIEKYVREKIDYILNGNFSEVVFGNTSCISITDSGKHIFECFLDAYVDMMKPSITKAVQKSQARIKKYTKNAKLFKK